MSFLDVRRTLVELVMGRYGRPTAAPPCLTLLRCHGRGQARGDLDSFNHHHWMMRKIATITLVTFPSPETSLVASSMPYLPATVGQGG